MNKGEAILPSALRETAKEGRHPEAHVPSQKGVSWGAMACKEAQRGVKYADCRVGLRRRHSKPRCWSNAENVNHRHQEYPHNPKPAGFAVRWIREVAHLAIISAPRMPQ